MIVHPTIWNQLWWIQRCLHRQKRVFDWKWRLLPQLHWSENWFQLLLPRWIRPEVGQENLWRWEESGRDQVWVTVYYQTSFISSFLFFPRLQTLMNVLRQTAALRSASTCLAATSVTARRATRSTLRPKHARLNQVMFPLKTCFPETTDKQQNPDWTLLLGLLQAPSPPCTSPTDMMWGSWLWTAVSTSGSSHSWKTQWLWTWICQTRWSSGLTYRWRKSTG